MKSLRGSAKARRLVVLLVGAVLLGWIVLDVATGRGPWTATGKYAADLLGRAGPSRDLLKRLRRATGQTEKRPVKLRVWDWWSPSTTEDYADYFEAIESRFEQRHPDVDVVFQAVPFGNYEQKLSAGMLGDRPPDVFQCSVYWAEGLYNRGMLRRLNDLIAETPELQSSEFLPSTWYHNRRGDHVFGIPQSVDSSCLLWNLDLIKAEPDLHYMFERNADGTPDFTRIRFDAVRDWAHFRQIVKRLAKRSGPEGTGELVQVGMGMNAYGMGPSALMPWASANGVTFQNKAGTRAMFDVPATVQTMRFLSELYWKDRVCPPFRRELTSYNLFQQGKVGCTVDGTWSGKYLVRNTQGWMGFGMTAFPPGPAGKDYKTMTWANMMVMSSCSSKPRIAWDFIRLTCGLEGALLKLKYLNQNSARLDFYEGDAWTAEIRKRPYLSNIKRICASGDPLNHTQPQAVADEVAPIFEYLLLNWPDVSAGRGRFGSLSDSMHLAAARVNEVYDRYSKIVRDWDRQLGRTIQPEGN